MNLRDLRLWHWRIAMRERQAAQDNRCSDYTRKVHDRTANFHIKAVQALNDVVSGTAEMDDAPGRSLEKAK
jgi:hypothetical protein